MCVCGVELWSLGSWWDQNSFSHEWLQMLLTQLIWAPDMGEAREHGLFTHWKEKSRRLQLQYGSNTLWTKRSRDSQRKTDFSLHFLIFSRLKGKCSSNWKLRILVPYHIDFLSSLSTCVFTPCNSFFYVLQGEMFSYIVFIRIISPQKLPVTPQNT